MKKLKQSFKNINYKLFISLLIMGLCPTIYTTLRVFLIGQLPGEYSFSIAGQLSWVNLLYEIISEAIILPLYFFIGNVIQDKKELTNRIKTGLLITLSVYLLITIIILIFADPLLKLMATSPDIIEASATYIRIESIANIFSIISSFVLIVLIDLGKSKNVYLLTFIKLILCMLLDIFLVSSLPISINLGINGIAITNIIVNLLLFIVTIIILYKEKINIFNNEKLNFNWLKDFFKISGISGIESFVRNIFLYVNDLSNGKCCRRTGNILGCK